MKVLIGNYPYKHINFDSVLNNFDENCRFNCVLLNENNGKKCDELILCCHLYENVKKTFDWKNNSRTAQLDYLYSKYKHCYTKEYLYKFYQNFQPSQYKIGHIKKEKNEQNIWRINFCDIKKKHKLTDFLYHHHPCHHFLILF